MKFFKTRFNTVFRKMILKVTVPVFIRIFLRVDLCCFIQTNLRFQCEALLLLTLSLGVDIAQKWAVRLAFR